MMFLLDSLMISGISWALRTVVSAAEAEMNDDSALREALLEAEMRREMGEISDEEFGEIEADLLTRIREIKARREGGAGPLAFGGAQPMETSPGSTFQIEAEISGDFYGTGETPHTEVIAVTPEGVQDVTVTPVDVASPPLSRPPAAAPRPRRTARTSGPSRRTRTAPAARTNRTTRTNRQAAASRATRTTRTKK
jgi:hypothetical protein